MGRQQQELSATGSDFRFYRTTAKGETAEAGQYAQLRSLYVADVLQMCARGIWEPELRQFMPPASLAASVSSLLELGLIECIVASSPAPRPKTPVPRWSVGLTRPSLALESRRA